VQRRSHPHSAAQLADLRRGYAPACAAPRSPKITCAAPRSSSAGLAPRTGAPGGAEAVAPARCPPTWNRPSAPDVAAAPAHGRRPHLAVGRRRAPSRPALASATARQATGRSRYGARIRPGSPGFPGSGTGRRPAPAAGAGRRSGHAGRGRARPGRPARPTCRPGRSAGRHQIRGLAARGPSSCSGPCAARMRCTSRRRVRDAQSSAAAPRACCHEPTCARPTGI